MKNKITTKISALLFLGSVGENSLYAASIDASKVSGAINDAADIIKDLFEAGTNLVYATVTIIGLISAVNVYTKFSSGDNDASKRAGAWLAGCIAIFVCVKILEEVFL